MGAKEHFDVVQMRAGVYDVLMGRTGRTLYDKRRNAGQCQGLECWRSLKRDFGATSAGVQPA